MKVAKRYIQDRKKKVGLYLKYKLTINVYSRDLFALRHNNLGMIVQRPRVANRFGALKNTNFLLLLKKVNQNNIYTVKYLYF